MAIKKVRIRPEGENNYADIIHPETSADIVVDTPTKVVMTKEERDKLSGIQAGANKTTIDNTLTSTSTTQALSANQGKVLDNKIGILNGNLTNLEYSELSSTATNIDDEGIYANIEWRRKNNTLYAKSILIGDTPNYNQIKMDFYNESGTTIIKSIAWDIAYDDNDFPYQRTVI